MTTSFRYSLVVATAFVGLSGFAALAAPPGAGDPTAANAAGNRISAPGKPAARSNMEVNVEQRIAALHTSLKITDAEKPQWDAFVQVMRDNAANMDSAFAQRVSAMQGMTAVDNMQSYAQFAEMHAQDMQKLVPAFKTLYDSLPDSQKQLADQVFRNDANHGNTAQHS